ncbi:MAG: isoprenylcysteine carboxylmethyltransferase family protein [Thermodesulfobacteriales bacterium]|nr:MAG: isoprenylcysteine carboxylmethyltransferase family protein [Thermodesulfobacteriales bacterium]
MKKKIMPDGYFTILLLLSILIHYMYPIVNLVLYPYNLIGIILIIAGIVITLITNFALLKKKTSIKPFDTPTAFITSGPFKISRNPIYLGMTIILIGVETVLGSLSPYIFPVIFVVIINILIIPVEEKDLENKFGEKYLEYKTKVRRWI